MPMEQYIYHQEKEVEIIFALNLDAQLLTSSEEYRRC